MKLIFTSLLLISLILPLFGQSVKFTGTSYDFGTIKEEAGSVQTVFEFKNISKDTILISEIKASCTCTKPVYTKDAVPPGKKSTITAIFDPQGRAGVIDKSLSVAFKKWPEDVLASPEMVNLDLKGTVTPKPKAIAEAFPIQMGKMRIIASYIPFDSLFTDIKRTVYVTIFNDSPEPLKLVRTDVPAFIKITPEQGQMNPMDSLKLTIVIDGATAEDWGNVYYSLRIYTDEPENSEKSFSLFGYRGDNIAKMTDAQKAQMPKAKFETREANFGNIVQGTSVEHEFKVTNEGKSDLIIRKWKPGCGCTSSQPDKMVLKPGETAISKAVFNSTGQSGAIHKSITVVTNDPIEPMVILFLHGDVKPGDADAPAKPKIVVPQDEKH